MTDDRLGSRWLRRGQVTVCCGRRGSGKSAFLQLVAETSADASVVLVDDAFDDLASAEVRDVWRTLHDLADRHAVLVTTRDAKYARPGGRVLLIAHGTVIADGPPAAVLDPVLLARYVDVDPVQSPANEHRVF